MSLFKNLTHSKDIAETKDTLGGGSFVKESGVYDGVIKMAFATTAASGAMAVELHIDLEDGTLYRETIYVTNRNGENFYKDKKTGAPRYLPNFVTVDELCAITTSEYLAAQETEPKTFKLYDKEAKTEINKEVPTLTALSKKKVKLGIIKKIENKQTLNESTGKWVDTNETRESNEINKVFSEDGFTLNELLAKADEPEFITDWITKNEGYTRDTSKVVGGTSTAKPGVGKPTAKMFPTAKAK